MATGNQQRHLWWRFDRYRHVIANKIDT